MTVRLEDQESWGTASLAELRKLSCDAIQQLSERDLWEAENEAALKRCKDNRIDVLLDEFRSQLHGPGECLQYELAFVPGWHKACQRLYDARWWINGQTAGVYFIYNSNNVLEYVGTSCGGTIGARIHLVRHREYAHSVDVVLFERHWPHFALAFEALAISRLKPPRNVDDRGFMRMWVDPLPQYDHLWSKSSG